MENKPARKSFPQDGKKSSKNPDLEENLEPAKAQLQELDDSLKATDKKEDKYGCLNEWSSKVASSSYPDIGTRAYAVPYYFHGFYRISKCTGASARESPEVAPPIEEADGATGGEPVNQESQPRPLASPAPQSPKPTLCGREQRKVFASKEVDGKQPTLTPKRRGAVRKDPRTVKAGGNSVERESGPSGNDAQKVEEKLRTTSYPAAKRSDNASREKSRGRKSEPVLSSSQHPPIATEEQRTPPSREGSKPRGKGTKGASRRTSLEDPQDEFVVCTSQESDQRGDMAHRIVGRTFSQILNAELEREKKRTMFIISQLNYDNLLPWIRKGGIGKVKQYIPDAATDFKHVFDDPNSYLDIREIEEQLEGRRGELDLMVLHQDKGIILIQIKSVSRGADYPTESDTASSQPTPTKDPDQKVHDKVKHACEQLEKDVNVFEKVMRRSRHWQVEGHAKVKRVIALPNLSRRDVEELRLRDDVGEDVIFLCKDDLPEEDEDSIKKSESETDIGKFRVWWNSLPNLEDGKELALDFMKEIIGKYIGPLSAVLETKPGNHRERVITFRNCVQQTSLLLAYHLLTQTQRDILEIKSKDQRRVYISGPPGSGKTVLLILKAHTFLTESSDHQVIVVNMYRGAQGRAIGNHTFTILNKLKHKVHHLEYNVHTKNFVQEVEKVLANIGINPGQDGNGIGQQSDNVGEKSNSLGQKSDGLGQKSDGVGQKTEDTGQTCEGAKLTSEGARPKNRGASSKSTADDRLKPQLKNVLFLVDEIYVESFWQEILGAFCGEFAESHVWCAGLFSKNPTGFVEHELDFVLRCPPAVQNLLYHVDWDERRKKKYRRDTEWIEVSTNGPIPLCVRHECHVQSACSSVPVIHCAQCGKELAHVLKTEKFVKTPLTRRSEPPPCVHGGDTSFSPSSSSDLKVVILVNMPQSCYSQSGMYIEATQHAYTDYMDRVKSSTFVKALRDQGIHVNVKVELGCRDMATGKGSEVTATWLYNFQGLEAGVVIFLPGDVSPGDVSSGDVSPGDVSSIDVSRGDASPKDVSPGDVLPGDLSPGGILPKDVLPEGVSPNVVSPRDVSPGDGSSGDVSPKDLSFLDVSAKDMSRGDVSLGDVSPKVVSPADVSPADLLPNLQSTAPSRKIPTPGLAAVSYSSEPSPALSGSSPGQGADTEDRVSSQDVTQTDKEETDKDVAELCLPAAETEQKDTGRDETGKLRSRIEATDLKDTCDKEPVPLRSQREETVKEDTATKGAIKVPSCAGDTGQEETVEMRSQKEIGAAIGGEEAEKSDTKRTSDKTYSLTLLQWRNADIERFSDWDKTNILVAGSRSLALLILIVP